MSWGKLVGGNIVYVSLDIASHVNVLPRSMSNTDTPAMKFKEEKNISNVNLRKINDQWLFRKL